MKISHLLIAAGFTFFCNSSTAQNIKFAGTHPPDTAVLNLLSRYEQAARNFKTVAERDAKRKPLLSNGYFYHGLDGAPVSLDSLTRRQTKNNFSPASDSLFSFTLFQYENTAVFSYKVYGKGMDKGKPFENTNSSLILMSKESGSWKIIADILGQDPKQLKTK